MMGFHENINLAATHRQQTPLINDGIEKNRIRGSVDGAMMMSEMNVMVEIWRVVRYGDFHFLVGHEGLLSPQGNLPN